MSRRARVTMIGLELEGDTRTVKKALRSFRNAVSVRACRVCGCTDADCSGCVERTGRPCHWVEKDLCSACVETEEAS